MDGTCSNVMTTEARSRNMYFGGTCNQKVEEAYVFICSEEEYWGNLTAQAGDFIPFDDSVSDFGFMFVLITLLLCFV
eukprot:TRINITY_DN426_c0_g1_i1.p2 TRINITY_DN426_c0_g1~~TRINITY_DN426_c0_g1_i1.p2  ORF type:complete len:77 (+),score=13.00 TRINITY_DN426_c0_g1_i1:322-552(+)